MKRFLLPILVLACSLSAWCQYASVSATLTDGTGSFAPSAYLHFSLRNCGANFPVVKGQSFTPAKVSFDLKPNPATGVVNGQVVGNDQILCGNVASTYYEVAMMKDQNTAFTPEMPFIIASNSSWTPASQPMSNPPQAPGFVYIFGNPTGTQTVTQPTGSTLFFVTQGNGTIDFSGATVNGLGGSSAQGLTGTIQTRGNNGNFNGKVMLFADDASGGDCGAKIVAQDTALGASSGEIWVTTACGLTITTPVNLSAYHSLKFVQGGTWLQSATITQATGSSIVGIPSSISEDVLTRPSPAVVLKQAANANLTNMVLIEGENTELRDLGINGNNPTNPNTVCVAVDDTNTSGQSRSHLHWDHLTVAQCGGDDAQLFSTTTSNQAAVAEIDYSSFNRSLNGNGLSIRDSTDMHIHFSKFQLNSGYGTKWMNSVVWLWDSDVSGNSGGQLYMGVDADSALSVSLTGGFNLIGNGFTGTALGSGSCGGHLCENTQSNIIVNGYNGTTCNVLGNGYAFMNTINLPLGTDPNQIDGIRVMDSGSNQFITNKFISGASGNTFKYGLRIGNVAAGCTSEPTDLSLDNQYESTFGTAPYLLAPSTDNECPIIGASPGCQQFTFGQQCVTGGAAGNTCATPTVNTWPVPFADSNYVVTCTQTGAPTSGVPVMGWPTAQSGASFTLQWIAGSAAAAQASGIQCIGKHL